MQVNFTNPESYQICMQALGFSSRTAAVTEWDSYVDMLKKLKALGVVNGELWETKEPEAQNYTDLDRAQITILIECIEKTTWRAMKLDVVAATRKWLKNFLEA